MSGTVGPGTRTRADQYTTNKETDFYVSDLAEDGLENPFKKNSFNEPIADADTAAIAALLSRNQKPTSDDDAADSDSEESDRSLNYTFVETQDQAIGKDSPGGADGVQTGQPFKSAEPAKATQPEGSGRRKSSTKRSQSTLLETVSGSINNLDPEAKRLAKRSRTDDGALVVQPGDNAQEEDAKMRANLIQNSGIIPEDDEPSSDEEAISTAAGDAEDHPNEVGPVPLMDQISGKDKREEIPSDVGDKYDDVEARRDDDYDPGDYVRFEDDEDDMGQAMAEDGAGMDERFIGDVDDLVPESGENASISP